MKISLRIYKGNLVPADNDAREKLDSFAEGAFYECNISDMDKRTLAQNRLIHQFCKNIADEAQKQNFTLKQLVKDGTPISMLSAKELMFKPVVMSLYGKDSTTKLEKKDFDLVFDTVIMALGSYGLDTSKLLKD